MRKIEIPRQVDFQPAKEFKNRFEREGGRVRDIVDYPEIILCECGRQMFLDQKICGGCFMKDSFYKDYVKRFKNSKVNKVDSSYRTAESS